jgi:DNA repair exonuclease SbcCD ATPase subunit
MIVFEKVRWKNFLSTGNGFTEVNLNTHRSTLIIGSNGAGKSTMMDALCFALFNKPFRKINKPQLVNSINERECVVEVEFSIGSTQYKVVRGIKPNVFEIHRNGNLIDQDAANRDYQKYLEQSILKFNFKSFTQVVILGSSTFVPFMQLPAAHRREVIEDLLDIQVFSRMNMLLKDRVKEIKGEISECEHSVALAQNRYDMQTKNVHRLSALHSKNQEDILLRKEQWSNAITECETGIDKTQQEIDNVADLLAKSASNKDSYHRMRDLVSSVKHKIQDNLSMIQFFTDNGTCPTCTQEIDTDLKHSQIKTLKDKDENFYKKLDEMQPALKKIEERVNSDVENAKLYETLKTELKNLKTNKRSAQARLQDLQPNQDDASLKCEEKTLAKYKEDLDAKLEECAKVNANHADYTVVSKLLKDGGIKTRIIQKFVPIINQRINKYLQEMDFFVNFTLDEEFNEVIKSRFRDEFSYASFSEGEKQKIDLALLFTWRDVARLKNSTSTNLLILDEVFDSSLDSTATEELLKILKGLGTNTNLYIISHKGELLLDKFETTIEFVKENDFSSLRMDD